MRKLSEKLKLRYLAMRDLKNSGWTNERIGAVFGHPRGHVCRCLKRIHQEIAAGLTTRVFIIILAFCGAVKAGDNARPQNCAAPGSVQVKPCLDVWCAGGPTDPGYDNQRAFWQTYRENPAFRQALDSRYCVRCFWIRNHIVFAMTRGITTGPTFIRAGQGPLVGFRGADVLLAELGISQAPPTPPVSGDSTPAAPTAPGQSLEDVEQTLAKALLAEIQQLEERLRAEQSADHQKRDRDALQQLKQLKELQQQLTLQGESLTHRCDLREGQLQQIADQLAALQQGAPSTTAPSSVPAIQAPVEQSSFWSRTVTILGTTLSVAQALGLVGISGGSFGLAGLAVWGIGWILKRKATAATSAPLTPERSNESAATSRVPCLQCVQLRKDKQQLANKVSELLNQVTDLKHDQPANTLPVSPMFAPYETDHVRDAFEWGSRELVRKFPGAVENLEQLKALMNQHLQSKGKKGI